eukprot:TRINITY_DN19764_c0_g1_i1.p1 TRINITY_DN19764_c0_g1~~TRINITY_DN19764_c0_g1_i1.p1  ORF type:complete len:269 (+),score=47.50 TRINITY_DN19764_c0_g1_i1:38-808(+)
MPLTAGTGTSVHKGSFHRRANGYEPVPTAAPLGEDGHLGWGYNGNQPCGAHGASHEGQGYASSFEMDDREGRLKQAELKTSVFDTYSVCAALLASFCCSLPYVSAGDLYDEPYWRQLAVGVQQWFVRFCTVGAVHAMLVFMFSALYAKSALSRARWGLELYEMFSEKTGGIRQTAFWILYCTSIAFCLQVAASSFFTFTSTTAIACFAMLLLVVSFTLYDTLRIISAASVIFLPDEAVQAHLLAEAASSERSDTGR